MPGLRGADSGERERKVQPPHPLWQVSICLDAHPSPPQTWPIQLLRTMQPVLLRMKCEQREFAKQRWKQIPTACIHARDQKAKTSFLNKFRLNPFTHRGISKWPLLPPACCSIQLFGLSLLTLQPAEIIQRFCYSWLGCDEASCQVRGICKGAESWKLCQLFIHGRQLAECCQNVRASVSLQASVPPCATIRNVSISACFMNTSAV